MQGRSQYSDDERSKVSCRYMEAGLPYLYNGTNARSEPVVDELVRGFIKPLDKRHVSSGLRGGQERHIDN